MSVVSFAAGIAFLMMGAWPVFGFFGLDVLAIYWAFRLNFRRARRARKFRSPHPNFACDGSAIAATRRMELNPLWVRLDRRSTRSSASSGFIWFARATAIDREFSRARTKRRVLPKRYRQRLQTAKRGPTYNPVS